MEVGEMIKCKGAEEAVDLMEALAMDGVMTDFVYEKGGEKGIWLEVLEVESNGD